MYTIARPLLFLFAASLPVLSGCFGDGFPETYPVTGVVTYQGAPVEGASVTLIPSDPEGKSAGGTTDAEGKFEVSTYFSPQQQSPGALPGEYTVTVRKLETQEVKGDFETGEEEMAAYMKMGPPKDLLPAEYSGPKTSTLKVTVEQAPPQPLVLDL